MILRGGNRRKGGRLAVNSKAGDFTFVQFRFLFDCYFFTLQKASCQYTGFLKSLFHCFEGTLRPIIYYGISLTQKKLYLRKSTQL